MNVGACERQREREISGRSEDPQEEQVLNIEQRDAPSRAPPQGVAPGRAPACRRQKFTSRARGTLLRQLGGSGKSEGCSRKHGKSLHGRLCWAGAFGPCGDTVPCRMAWGRAARERRYHTNAKVRQLIVRHHQHTRVRTKGPPGCAFHMPWVSFL